MESAERYREWANVHGHDGRAAAVLQRGWLQKRRVGAARRTAGRRAARDGPATALQDAFRRARRRTQAQLAERKRRHMLLVLFMLGLKAAHAMQRAYFRFADRKRHGAAATVRAGWRDGGRAAAARGGGDAITTSGGGSAVAIAAAFARGEAPRGAHHPAPRPPAARAPTERAPRRFGGPRGPHAEDRAARGGRARGAARARGDARAEEKLRAAHDDGAAAARRRGRPRAHAAPIATPRSRGRTAGSLW